jgi:uncharacterized protein YutE (UPF0331/DUF86 family)/predicted nucleotidyltransferase
MDMTGCRLTLDYVLPRLKELFDRLENVELAVLFGSMARSGVSGHDVDIALKLAWGGLLDVGYIVSQVAKALGVNEDFIDVVVLDWVNPIMLSRILEDGIVIKMRPEALKRQLEKAGEALDALMEFKLWAAVDPKLDKTVIVSRVEDVRRNVAFIKGEILSKKVEELDYRDSLALERAMYRVVGSMLDVCRHLVSVYSLGFVESYGEYPRRLAEAGRMPRGLAEDLERLAGLRNILVHRYLEVRIDLLYKTAEETVERIAGKFIEWVKTINY